MFPSNSSELTIDFQKPMVVAALRSFDPQLLLVFSRRVPTFQVMRRTKKVVRHGTFNGGTLCSIEESMIWVTDWKYGIEGRDDPEELLRWLYYSDVQRFPNLSRELEEKAARKRADIVRHIQEEYRHAHLENRRLLERAWAPVFDSPGFVN